MSKDRRYLLVEDDRMLRRATQNLLKRTFDADITAVSNGQEALELLETELFDIIITDYFMPKIDGRELILKLRARGDTTPIIGVTAATIGVEQDELNEAGADVVMSKPLNNEDLAVVLLQFLSSKLEPVAVSSHQSSSHTAATVRPAPTLLAAVVKSASVAASWAIRLPPCGVRQKPS